MRLIITEKPSVAKDIARVLKISERKDGYFQNNQTRITWAFGHLVRLADPPAYDPAFERWDLTTLPVIPETFILEVQKDSGVKKQFETIQSLLKDPALTEVVCATDAGREGELIFRHLYALSGVSTPILRLWISSQTDQAILEGFENLKPGNHYNPLYESALSRSEADWIIGLNATRAYTCRFSRGQGVMSVGRVQTPVLKMIVDRYLLNVNFKPETYHEIEATLQHPNGSFTALWINADKDNRVPDQATADAIVQTIQANPKGSVIELNQQSVQEKPPLLYDLTELQKEANRKFKYSADETLKIMQSLYETHKILTYPRTSSRYLSQDLKPKMKGLLQNVANIEAYHSISSAILAQPLNLSSRLFNDAKVTDHHAIIPTDQKPNLSALSQTERSIYDLVIRRFLAGFMDDCIKDQTEVISELSTHRFRSFGSIIRQPGWRHVYANDKDDDPDNLQILPAVKEKDSLDVATIERLDKKTKAPALYSEASILAAMETAGKAIEDEELRQAMKHCGLGTPATRAQILERLIKVDYIVREKNRLIPTPKGIQLISYIQDKALLSAELTGDWELKLNNIVSQTYSRDLYMKEIKQFAHDIIQNVKACTIQAVGAVKDSLGPCPICGGAVIDTKMAYSCSQWKATNCSFKIWKTIASKPITEPIAKDLLKNKTTKVLKGFKSKEGKAFVAALTLDAEGKVGFQFDDSLQETIGPCPLCEGRVIERKMAFGCENWKKTGCSFTIWKTISGKDITKTLAKTLLKKHETPSQTGFKSREGTPFEAKLKLVNGAITLERTPKS